MNLLDSIWNLVFLAGFVAYVAIRGKYIELTRRNEKVLRRVDGLERGLMGLVFLGSLLAPLLYLLTPLLDFADYALPSWAPWCGTAALVLALWLFRRAHADLGLNWSVSLEIRKDHDLVARGVYARMRHPMYCSILLFGVAQALLLANAVAGPAAFLTFLPLYFVRTPREERLMLERFGEAYRAYMLRTWRIVPKP